MRRFPDHLLRASLLGLLALLLLPAIAQAAGNAYVANSGSNTLSQYGIGAGGELSSLIPASVAAGTTPVGVAVTPDGKSAYVTNFGGDVGGDTVSQYTIDPVSGALSPKSPASVATGVNPEGVAVTPDGKSAYVTNYGGDFGADTVSQYTIDPVSGALSPKSPASVAAGSYPDAVAVTPDGNSAYVINVFDNTVSQYTIDPVSGALSPKSPAVVAAGSLPIGVAVTPDGKSAYVTNLGADTVSQYTIDPVSGALSPKSPASVAAGVNPEGVAVTPDGKSAYVTNYGADTVSQYTIDPVSGALSPKSPASVAAGSYPDAVAVTPDGKSAYVINVLDNTVSQYTIDPLSGALSPKSLASVATGSYPTAVAVRPPGVPTSKEQCKDGGWRNYPQFKNQGQCEKFVNHP